MTIKYLESKYGYFYCDAHDLVKQAVDAYCALGRDCSYFEKDFLHYPNDFRKNTGLSKSEYEEISQFCFVREPGRVYVFNGYGFTPYAGAERSIRQPVVDEILSEFESQFCEDFYLDKSPSERYRLFVIRSLVAAVIKYYKEIIPAVENAIDVGEEVIEPVHVTIDDSDKAFVRGMSVALERIESTIAEGLQKSLDVVRQSNDAMASALIEKTVQLQKMVTDQDHDKYLEAIKAAVSDVAVEEMIPRIKDRIIQEFGYEPVRHEIIVDTEVTQVDGIIHEKFDSCLHFITNDVPIFLVGPSGVGKNVLLKHCAEALSLDYYFMNSVTDEFKFTGFIDAMGVYHESEFYTAFVKGGLFFLDELDASVPEVLVMLNAAIANKYFTFPIGHVEAHENFRVVAAGNTMGTGADTHGLYTGRTQLDAASLNRFVVLHIDYDKRIDRFMSQNDEALLEFVWAMRKAVKKCGLPMVISYRNINQIVIAIKKESIEDSLSSCLLKEATQDDVNNLIKILQENNFDSSNDYYQALQNMKVVS